VRFLPEITYPMAGGNFTRQGLSYPVWMAQRMLDAFRKMSKEDADTVRAWLQSVGGEAVLELDLPKVRRMGLAAGRIS
jgi:alpha-amylase/alpha-mannosidase (GH57 family)